MRKRIPEWTAIALMAYSVLAGTGCITMIASKGTVLPLFGEVRDGREFNPDALEEGLRVEIGLRNGTRLSGRIVSIGPLPKEDYAARYEEVREALSIEIRLPAIGQMVALEDIGGQRFEGLCEGFDKGTLYAILPERDQASPLLLARVRFMVVDGVQQGADRLRTLLADGRIPYRRAMTLDRDGKTAVISLNEIRDLRIRKSLWPSIILDVLAIGGIVYYVSTLKFLDSRTVWIR